VGLLIRFQFWIVSPTLWPSELGMGTFTVSLKPGRDAHAYIDPRKIYKLGTRYGF